MFQFDVVLLSLMEICSDLYIFFFFAKLDLCCCFSFVVVCGDFSNLVKIFSYPSNP